MNVSMRNYVHFISQSQGDLSPECFSKADMSLINYINYKIDLKTILKRYINYVNLSQYNLSSLDDFKTKEIELYLYENIHTAHRNESKPKKESAYFVIKRNKSTKINGVSREADSENDSQDMPSLTEIQLNK